MSHDELNALCAEKVAGWNYWQSKHGHWHVTAPDGTKSEPLFGYPLFDSETGQKIVRPWWERADIPDYVNDPAAVIALLEKDHYDVEIHFSQGCDMWSVRLLQRFTGKDSFSGKAESFAEAGVRALLKAHGCEGGE